MAEEDSSGTSFPLFEQLATGVKRAPLIVRRTPVTVAVCAIIVVLFVCVRASHDSDTALVRFGYRTAFQVWTGSVWSLWTNNVIHQWYWHVAFNLYWMWRLGIAIEEAIGSVRMLVFVLASAFVSSAVQLAMFEDVGYGASGIVYALFGFGWLARRKYDSLKATFTPKTFYWALAWLVGCFVVAFRTIGNGAHLGGLAFGACAALPFVWERRRWLAPSVPLVLLVVSGAAGLVCPWSAHWWATMGYRAHARGAYPLAAEAYRMSLEIRPDQPWVRENLSNLTGDAGARTTQDSGP